MDKKTVVHYTIEYYTAIKKKEFLPFAADYYAKQNEPVRERKTPYDLINMWNLMNKIS